MCVGLLVYALRCLMNQYLYMHSLGPALDVLRHLPALFDPRLCFSHQDGISLSASTTACRPSPSSILHTPVKGEETAASKGVPQSSLVARRVLRSRKGALPLTTGVWGMELFFIGFPPRYIHESSFFHCERRITSAGVYTESILGRALSALREFHRAKTRSLRPSICLSVMPFVRLHGIPYLIRNNFWFWFSFPKLSPSVSRERDRISLRLKQRTNSSLIVFQIMCHQQTQTTTKKPTVFAHHM